MQSKSRTQTIADVPRQFAGMEDVNLHWRENAPCRPARVVRRGAIIFADIYTAPRQANVGIAGCSGVHKDILKGLCFPVRRGTSAALPRPEQPAFGEIGSGEDGQ